MFSNGIFFHFNDYLYGKVLIMSNKLNFIYNIYITLYIYDYGNPLQYSCLENSMDTGTWWITVPGFTKGWT